MLTSPLAFSVDYERVVRYADELRLAASEALPEESIMVTVMQVYHAVVVVPTRTV